MKKHGFSMIELVVSLMLLGIIYLNVAGLFKTNLHQDQVFYGTFADTWNQYNTVIDAVYNRKSIPLTSTTATVVLTDVATLLEQEMLSNTPTVIAKDSVVLQKLSVQYKLPTHKDIKYDILSINTLDNKIIASDGIVHTDEIQSYLPVHKTRVWTLAKNKAYITSSTQYNKYFPDFANIQKLTYVKLRNPIPFDYGHNYKDTLFYSHLYYVESLGGHTVPYVLGYDSNGYGIAIKASDQIAYPTYLTRTPSGATYKYKIDEFPAIPLRQAFYYAGMPVLYRVSETPTDRFITISISEIPTFTATTMWGDFESSGYFARYTYNMKCAYPTGGKCNDWYLDINKAANKITVMNWLPGESRGDILLTSDIVELSVDNILSGPYFYGRTVVPINLIYELSRGKIYASLDAHDNIVLKYNQDTHLTSVQLSTHLLSEKAKVNSVKDINKDYNFPWGAAKLGENQSSINVTVPANALLQTQNMLAKTITFTVTVTPRNYSDPINKSGSCIETKTEYKTCKVGEEIYRCSGPGDVGDNECVTACGAGYRCKTSNTCRKEVEHHYEWEWAFQENVAYLYGGIRLTAVTANVKTPQGTEKITWATDVYYSMDKIPKEGVQFTITATLWDPEPTTLANYNANIVKTLFDPDHTKIGDIEITYDFTFQVSANAQINIYYYDPPCDDDPNPAQYIKALSSMLQGINVQIKPDENKSTFVPALTFAEALPYNIYSFRASPNPQLYVFTSAYTAKADYSQKDFTGWYTTDDLQCGSGVICSILSSNPMRDLKLYSTEYVVTKQLDARYYLSHTPAQVRNNISNDSYYAIFHGYTPNIRLEGVPIGAGGRVSVIGKKPLTLAQINDTEIRIEKIMVKEKTGGPIPYQ